MGMIRELMLGRRHDFLAVLLIFIASVLFFWNIVGTGTLMDNGHYLHEQTFFTYNYKDASAHGTLPFWTPYWYSGQPLYADSQVFFINLTTIFMVLFGNIFLAIGLSSMAYLFIAGTGMYFLGKYLISSRAAAFIAAMVYMFNGLIIQFVKTGNPSILEPYALMPLIFLFVVKAARERDPVFYSILAGTLMALQVFSGGVLMLLYTLLLVGAYLAFTLAGRDLRKNFLRALAVGSVLSAVLFGLSAVKLLPNYGFIADTNRAQGLSYQEYLGEDYFVFGDFFRIVVLGLPSSSLTVHIGIVASVLMLLSLALWRKRMVLYMALVSLFVLLLGSGGFLAELFYNYAPSFDQTRHISRVLFIFVFAASVLAGYGFACCSGFLSKKMKSWDRAKIYAAAALVLLILAELVFVKGLPRGIDVHDIMEENELANYLGQEREEEAFRMTTFDVNDLISFFGSSFYAQYGLETISGGGGLWVNDFITYLAVAKNYNNSKLLGILNLKYAASSKEVEMEGFTLAKKFSECSSCEASGWTTWLDGPYLYENTDFLPRYYMVDNAVLVIGSQADDLIYSILLDSSFNPGNTVVIKGERPLVNDYDLSFLKRFDAIILLQGSIDQNSGFILQRYKESGKIFPDVLEGETATEFASIKGLFAGFNGTLAEVESEQLSQNEIILRPEREGFIVLSERFAGFDGWKAEKEDNRVEIMQADIVISAVYADSAGEIKFNYMPRSFKLGLLITFVTLLAVAAYLFMKKRKIAG